MFDSIRTKDFPWIKFSIQLLGVALIIYVFAPIILNEPEEVFETEEVRIDSSNVEINEITGFATLNHNLLLIEDSEKALDIKRLIGAGESALFESYSGELNFGFSQSAYWVKVNLSNGSENAKSVILRQDYPLIDHLSYWEVKGKEILKHIKTGDKEVFSSREINHKEFLFTIEVPAKDERTVYLRYETSGSMNIGLSLNTQTHLLTQFSNEQLAFGAYYGGVVVLAIYNMFLFFAAREKAFTHYLWYLISYGVYMSTHNGFAFQYLWPDNPWLANHSLLLLLALTLFWGLKFSQEIVATAIYAPRLDRFCRWLQYASIGLFIASFVAPYDMMILLLSTLTVIVTVAIFSMGIISLLARYRPAIFFMIAWSTFLAAVLVYMFKTFGWLPHNAFTQNAFQSASLIEMTLLSIALSHHFSELKKKSLTDALTFLFNRRHFDEKFENEFKVATNERKDLSLLVMDIDHFKKFNDTYGHAEGDKVIQFVASVLKNNVRKPLVPCRYGGEEFAVILPRTPKSSALVLAERIRSKVETDSDKERQVTISVGVASINDMRVGGRAIESPHALFEAADEALYRAKELGRNQVADFAQVRSSNEGLREE